MNGKSFPKLYPPLLFLMEFILSIEADIEGKIVLSVVMAMCGLLPCVLLDAGSGSDSSLRGRTSEDNLGITFSPGELPPGVYVPVCDAEVDSDSWKPMYIGTPAVEVTLVPKSCVHYV